MVTHSGSSPWHKEPRLSPERTPYQTGDGWQYAPEFLRRGTATPIPMRCCLPHASVKELATCFLQKGHAKLRRSVAYQPRTIGAGLASALSVGPGLIRLSVISACRSHHHAATSLDGLTCQPARLVAHEECHYVSNISRLPNRLSGVICAAVSRNESHNIAVSV